MDILKDFTHKDMIEQITILDSIKESHELAAIDPLLDLIATPLGDQAVDEMIYHCLFDLLVGQDDKIISGLEHASEDVQLLCVRSAKDGRSDGVKEALLQLLATTANSNITGEAVQTLVSFKDPNMVDSLLPYLTYEDCTVVAWAMQGLAEMKHPKVRDALISIIKKSDATKEDMVGCQLPTAMAVENLARFDDPETFDFLASFIHHPNPSFRRVVISTLAQAGKEVLPSLKQRLDSDCKDVKIMAANIIGMSGHREGADILMAQLEKTKDGNLKFAIYEALGRIPSMRSVVSLLDGLSEQEEMVLISVITALDHQSNPGVIKKIDELLAQDDAQAKLICGALITSHAKGLFTSLYKNGLHKDILLEAVKSSNDHEAAATFRTALEELGDAQANQDAQKLTTKTDKAFDKRILAADDSKAMLFFYKGVAADMGVEMITVEDGQQAFEHLQLDSAFDLIITDLNMPNMDGIELTSEIRKAQEWKALPILMATTESESGQSDRANQAGVTDFITKPFSKEDVKIKITQMLS